MEKVIIVGAGNHANVLIDIISKSNLYEIAGIIGHESETLDELAGYKVYKGDHFLEKFRAENIKSAALGIGGFTNNSKRKEMFGYLKSLGFDIINIIDPSANVSKTLKIGEGVVLFPGVIINTNVTLGDDVVIATGATIDHDTEIKSHVLVSAGVTIGGNVVIEESALLALGSKVISGVKVGSGALVAAGAVVVSNIEPNAKVFGIPAKAK